ncbi:MAG: molybdenum cofactor guanylyltransferase [Terriglobales bacterium]
MDHATGFVLAGGKSSRMGRDKAFLVLDGRTLLERALEHLRAVTKRVMIVGQREKFAAYGEVVEDVYPECGPLGGIHAALTASTTELNLVLAVDSPYVSAELLGHVLGRARNSPAVAVVPRAGGRLHPLCAVYRQSFRERAEAALRVGQHKIQALFTPDETLVLEEAELERLSFPAAMFENVNTPEEFERARRNIGPAVRQHG